MNETSFIPYNSSLLAHNKIVYTVVQTCQVFSVFGYLFVGYHLLSSPHELRRTLNHHIILLLLAFNLITLLADLSFLLNYIRTGIVSPSTIATCYMWFFIASYPYYSGLLLMTWASIERHVLIFHSVWLRTRKRRFFLHYLPIISIILYALVYYIYANFFYPCHHNFDFTSIYCGAPCYIAQSDPTLYAIELIVHQVVPTFLIVFFSCALLVRTLLSRRRLRQSVEWRKYRKMTAQLLSISVLYLLANIPIVLNPIASGLGLPEPVSVEVWTNIFVLWPFIICIFLPFVVAASLPNLGGKLKVLISIHRLYELRGRRQILPLPVNAIEMRRIP